jgi:hypothetical protein
VGVKQAGNFSGSFFSYPLFSTISVGSFLGSFFQQDNVFNNFSASFLGSFRFVFLAPLLCYQ